MQIKYSPDADILIIKLSEEKLVDSRDMAEGVILHISAQGQPLEIEVLDAARVIQRCRGCHRWFIPGNCRKINSVVGSYQALPECISQGKTEKEALENTKEAVKLHIRCLAEDGIPEKPLTIPNHKEIAKGTLRQIIKNTGLTTEEFRKLL